MVFLLVSDHHESDWTKMLRDILAQWGPLEIVSQERLSLPTLQTQYDLIIIDATTVKEIVQLVAWLRSRIVDARVVVTTVVPAWQEARDVFRAGALDYFPRTVNRTELMSTFAVLFTLHVHVTR